MRVRAGRQPARSQWYGPLQALTQGRAKKRGFSRYATPALCGLSAPSRFSSAAPSRQASGAKRKIHGDDARIAKKVRTSTGCRPPLSGLDVDQFAQVVHERFEDQGHVEPALDVVVGLEAAVGQDEDVFGLEAAGQGVRRRGGRRGRGRGVPGRRSARGRRGRTGPARRSAGWRGGAGRPIPCPPA